VKVAVTGATGFLGRYVLGELSRYDIEVIGIARNLSEHHKSLPVHHWACVNIAEPPMNAFRAVGEPDVLIHLAWDGLPNYRSLHHFEVELPRQYIFLRKLIEGGLRNLMVTGTCFEYGMQSGELFENTHCKPSNPYGFAKDTLRRQLDFLQQTQSFNLTWARLFYVYGDGQAKNSLWPLLKATVDRGESVFNMSAGEQLRDYLPVKQLVSYIVKVALLRSDVGVVNICSGKPISVRALVERWINDWGWTVKLNCGHYPYPDYEPFAFWGNNKKLLKITKKLYDKYK
jgi:dTDP-6-deoxy-L-talose 4-dehydrogenase (NAD+)